MEGAWHMNRIGKNIKKARSEKGYTQEQLAQKLCVTRNTISNYETGHSNPDIEMLQMLAEALKTDPNTLIYGEKKEQSADQTWRKEILKRVIWLVIAGLIIMISASLIQYGGEIAKDTLQVPMWSPWLNSVAYPIAYMIIGSQIMALVLQACGKRNSEPQRSGSSSEPPHPALRTQALPEALQKGFQTRAFAPGSPHRLRECG